MKVKDYLYCNYFEKLFSLLSGIIIYNYTNINNKVSVSSFVVVLQAQQDVVLEEYEQFDDYLEMVIQFGVRKKQFTL